MNLHLRYQGNGLVHPGPVTYRVPPDDSTVLFHYAVCDENGDPIETKAGRYESAYADSYIPHSDERAMLERLEAINNDLSNLARIWTVRSTPHPQKPGMARFEVVLTLPLKINFGEIELK